MRDVVLSTKFKKDLKLAKKRGKDLGKLMVLIDLLRAGEPLPAKSRDHALSGNRLGQRDCHVEGDWVLLYRFKRNDLELIELGTHSDVF